jgi:predicted metal-dependent hydrolase
MLRLLQLTLDLFSSEARPAPPQQPVSKPRRVRPPASKPTEPALNAADLWSQPGPVQALAALPQAQADAPSAATPNAPPHQLPAPSSTEPALSLAQALEPASYRHPQAKRQVMLSGVHVAYAFRRGKRRTIGFSVGAEGLAVSAPSWVPLREIDRAVEEKSDWILRKLQETRQRHQQLQATRIDWRDGAELPYLGQTVRLELDPGHRFGSGEELQGEGDQRRLRLGLPHAASAEQIRDAAQAWLMRRARAFFEQRLNHFAPQLGVQWTRLSLSSAATRWGSASAEGAIRLHWRLIHFSPQVIDYVVVHELSHLRVMDHSPRFWQTVGTVVPDYRQLRQQLKEQPLAGW